MSLYYDVPYEREELSGKKPSIMEYLYGRFLKISDRLLKLF